MSWHLTERSANSKTGPIAVTTSPETTCPKTCPFKGSGCYAESGPLRLHWRKVTSGARGTDLANHLDALRNINGGMLRLNQAGDLPANNVDARAILRAAAASGTVAWTYTHRKNTSFLAMLRRLAKGKTASAIVNVSGDSPSDADKYHGKGLPVVCVTASQERVQRTPKGTKIVLCPAQYGKTTCQTCGNGSPLCSRRDRKTIVGFYAHGTSKRKAIEVVWSIK